MKFFTPLFLTINTHSTLRPIYRNISLADVCVRVCVCVCVYYDMYLMFDCGLLRLVQMYLDQLGSVQFDSGPLSYNLCWEAQVF